MTTDPKTPDQATIKVRPAVLGDATALCALLNVIIRQGGTTAIEVPLTVDEFTAEFLTGPDVISCVVAESATEQAVLGFQGLSHYPDLPPNWADIATFADQQRKVPGVGTALFAATRAQALARGVIAINATIRADNAGGLRFYGRLGFEDYQVTPAVPLADGRPVDRISKRYLLR